jgi:hypothetical protein
MENVYGVKWEDPVQKLVEAASRTMKNRTGMGKAQAMAPQQPPGPVGRPPAVPPQPGMGGQGNPLADMIGALS